MTDREKQLRTSVTSSPVWEVFALLDGARSENATKDEEIARMESHAKALEESMALEGEEKDAAQAQLAKARKALQQCWPQIKPCASANCEAEGHKDCPYGLARAELEPSEEGAAPAAKDYKEELGNHCRGQCPMNAIKLDVRYGCLKRVGHDGAHQYGFQGDPEGSTSPVSAEARYPRFPYREQAAFVAGFESKWDGIDLDAAMLSAGLVPSVPAETPKVSMAELRRALTANNVNSIEAGIRACFRLAGCEDRIAKED